MANFQAVSFPWDFQFYLFFLDLKHSALTPKSSKKILQTAPTPMEALLMGARLMEARPMPPLPPPAPMAHPATDPPRHPGISHVSQLTDKISVQVSGHGEQHVRGFADPQLGLLDEVHLPIHPLLLLVLGVLKPGNNSTSNPRCLHPPSPFGQVRSDENCVQVLIKSSVFV